MGLTKRQTMIMWILTALLAALFAFAGISKLIPTQDAAEGFARLGYPAWVRIIIGVIELAGAIGILIPRRAAEAASFLIVIMLGALISSIMADESFIPPLLTLLMLGGLVSLRAEEVKES